MINSELDEKTRILFDTLTPQALAERVIELESLIRSYDEYISGLKTDYDKLLDALDFQGFDTNDILSIYEE